MFEDIVSKEIDGITYVELRVNDKSGTTMVYDVIFGDRTEFVWANVTAVCGRTCVATQHKL